MLGILPMLLSMFLTNVPSQAAIVMNAVGSTLVLYHCVTALYVQGDEPQFVLFNNFLWFEYLVMGKYCKNSGHYRFLGTLGGPRGSQGPPG